MLLQLFQHLSNGFYILFAFAFNIDEDVIEVHNYKNVKPFCQDLINVALECGWCICQFKRHHLVLKIAIAAFKGCFFFIIFFDPYLIVIVSEINMGETLSLT